MLTNPIQMVARLLQILILTVKESMTISGSNFSNSGTISVGAGMKFIFTSGTGDTFTNTEPVDLASSSEFSSMII